MTADTDGTTQAGDELTGSLETIDGRPALRFVRHLPHAIERVWRAVTEPAELERWFVATPPWTPEAGETFEAFGQSGTVTEVDPPRRIAWDFGDERYSFDLAPEGDGCVLTFVHVVDPEVGPAVQHASGWETYFARLDVHLGGGFLSEGDAHAAAHELNERYAVAFDDDPAPGRAGIARHAPLSLTLEDGPTLRFERRFRHARERVWRALTDPEELSAWFPELDALEVVETDEPNRLTARWFGDELRFELRPDGTGCVLVFTQAFDDRADAAKTAAGWDRCLLALHALLEGAPIGREESLELWPVVHERYAEAFGVDPAPGREAYEAASR